MAAMLGKLYAALRSGDVPEDKAREAAEEVAAHVMRFVSIDARLSRVEGRLEGVEARLGMLIWAVGVNVAATLAVLAKLLAH